MRVRMSVGAGVMLRLRLGVGVMMRVRVVGETGSG